MGARRLRLAVVALLCGLALVCVGGALPAVAGATEFGSYGTEPGQLSYVFGLGLDQETGDVYAPEFENERVSKFDGSGSFLFAWGWDVNRASPAEELQTCTVASGCRQGNSGAGAGQFASACGAEDVAVDNDPLSASYKDVYVFDFCNHRVQKFGPSGNFLLMFGGHVNATTGGDVCVLGEACTKGTEGSSNGEFESAYQHSYLAVGPGGAVYVGDKARIQVFEPSGAWRENVSLAGLSSEGKVTALAVDSSGDMFVADEGVSGVREFEPDGVEKATQFDAGSTSVDALTLDAAGDLLVADSSGGVHFLKFDPAGKELASFGSKTVGEADGIVFSDALDELYVSSWSSVSTFTSPPPGPLIEPGSENATAGLHGTATLEALVDPEGAETTYHFEYVDQARFEASGYAGASSTVPASAGSSFEDQALAAGLVKLAPGVYHYRVVASNSQGTATGPDQTFTTALVEGPFATGVYGTSAMLSAGIDPLGTSTEYRLEYGTSASYGHVLTGNVGEGSSYVTVSHHLQELEPGTEYHYRLVISDEFGTFESADHLFTTQTLSNGLILPDGRAWELVSPADKKGAVIEPFGSGHGIQAASTSEGITYTAEGPGVGEDVVGGGYSQVMSVRGPEGWRSQDLKLPQFVPAEGSPAGLLLEQQTGYSLFSQDLSQAAIFSDDALAPGVSEGTMYLRDDVTGTFTPLVDSANVPPGTKFGEAKTLTEQMHVLAATPDLTHVVFESPLALTPESSKSIGGEGEKDWNLYEWSKGRLQLLNILPDGKALTDLNGEHVLLAGEAPGEKNQIVLGATLRVISSDGRRVAWMWGEPWEPGFRGLYVRDTVEDKTVRVGGLHAVLQSMSSDGSRIFYLEGGELYEYNWETGAESDLTVDHGSGERSAGVQESLLGVSEDGSYIYFMARGVLSTAPNARGEVATPGQCINRNRQVTPPPGATCNLYVLHRNAGQWEAPRFIATLSREDEPSWYSPGAYGTEELTKVSSRVSPNGRYLSFMSDRSLTGYDNTDAYSGAADEEVYLYDAVADGLVCASCNPTGARPVGVFDEASETTEHAPLLVDRPATWTRQGGGTGDHWLAGSIPGWYEGVEPHQPRYLSDSGRLFFDSPDALVSQDTNGLEDVYEYEPPGVGDCTSASATFSVRSVGCVNLISSGTSSGESAFYDASENGDDVFFITSARLSSADYDTAYDVYDARVCSTLAPCAALPTSPPACDSGDSCKVAPSPQPEIFGPAPSATFSGVGNVIEEAKRGTVKHKAKKPKRKAKKHKKKHKKTRGAKARRSATRTASAKGHR
jgi:hypothetical protein